MSNIWVLSGGGAKGCFQAGAIYYLATKRDRYKPDSIAGTSVGALNALLPAQSWEGSLPNINNLTNIWLSLNDESDMYDRSEDFRTFDEDRFSTTLQSAIGFNLASFGDFMIGGDYFPEEEEFAGYEIEYFAEENQAADDAARSQRRAKRRLLARAFALVFVPSPSFEASLLVVQGMNVVDLVEDLKGIRSFYTLQPMEALIREQLNYDEFIRNTSCDLKLVSTSLNNRRVGYMDRAGIYYQIDAMPPDRSTVLGTDVTRTPVSSDYGLGIDRIIDGALASAAIPLAFPPILLNGHICVDGGISDTLPTRVVINDVARHLADGDDVRVIKIRCSPHQTSTGRGPLLRTIPRGRPSDLAETSYLTTEAEFEEVGVLDFAPGLIGTLSREVDRGDDYELDQFGDNIEQFDISPTFSINGTAQIDPGLIRIQLAYGFMRAFDVMEGNDASKLLTDEIILARLHAWRLEELSKPYSHSPPVVDRESVVINRSFVPGAIPKIRQMKVVVYRKTEERLAQFDRGSLPYSPDKHVKFDEVWYDGFERHTWQVPRTPWDMWMMQNNSPIEADTPPWLT